MNAANVDAYFARFRRVLEYIDAHPDGDLSLERLARVAAFSKYHFHRQFSAHVGLPVHEYVQLVRLERASYQLAYRAARSVFDVALDSGYESPEAFARAFKKRVGQTPSDFRERPRWEPWRAAFEPLIQARSRHMSTSFKPAQVQIVDFPETRVAALEHRGDPGRVGESVRRFIAWRKQHGTPPSRSATFNVFYDDPASTPPEDYRMDICAGVDGPVAPNAFGVVAKTLPGGRCALLRHVGPDDGLLEAGRFLYGEWLPSSGEELRDAPMFCRRVSLATDVPAHEAVTDVYLPLA